MNEEAAGRNNGDGNKKSTMSTGAMASTAPNSTSGNSGGPNCIRCERSSILDGHRPLPSGCGCAGAHIHPKCCFDFCMETEAERNAAGRGGDDIQTYTGANPAWTNCPSCGADRTNPLLLELAKLRHEHFRATFAETDPRYIASLCVLADAYQDPDFGDRHGVAKTMDMQRDIVRIIQTYLADNKPDPHGVYVDALLATMGNLGPTTAMATHDCDGGMTILEEALDIAKKAVHPAGTTYRLKMQAMIKTQMIQVLQLVGMFHPDGSINASGCFASTDADRKRLERIAALGEDVLPMLDETQGPTARHTLMAMKNVAANYLRMGRLDRALTLSREAMERARDVYGEDHPDTLALKSLHNTMLRGIGAAKHPSATLHGLKARPDLNGQKIDVVMWAQKERTRWVVRLKDGDDDKKQFSVGLKNILLDRGTYVSINDGSDYTGSRCHVEHADGDKGEYQLRVISTGKMICASFEQVAILM